PQAAGGERPAPTPEPARARHEATAVPPGARALSGLTEPLATVPAHELVAGLDRLQSAVTSLSARVDGLADATITFRSVMNERMDEYTETVLRAAKASATDVQEYRRMHTASLAELRRNTNDTAESLRRLTGWMEELGSVQGDEERWATALRQVLEQAAAERREDEQPVHQAVSTLLERLGRIEAGLGELAAQPAQPDQPAESPLSSALDDLPERLQRIDGALDRLGRELAAEPPDPLLPVVTSLGERLERIERSLDELATEPGDPLAPPVVEALVERLERIERTVDGLGDGPGDHRPALDDEDVRAIAAAVADLLDARAPAAAGRPQTATTGPVAAAAAPAARARGRRTEPIRAPSRGRSGR
ncbi:MAG: hypothetical protein M3N11_04650, partial [Actinomycetota bacterium]|nr:hypothetical protein [Actinomycetota bacterium]